MAQSLKPRLVQDLPRPRHRAQDPRAQEPTLQAPPAQDLRSTWERRLCTTGWPPSRPPCGYKTPQAPATCSSWRSTPRPTVWRSPLARTSKASGSSETRLFTEPNPAANRRSQTAVIAADIVDPDKSLNGLRRTRVRHVDPGKSENCLRRLQEPLRPALRATAGASMLL